MAEHLLSLMFLTMLREKYSGLVTWYCRSVPREIDVAHHTGGGVANG